MSHLQKACILKQNSPHLASHRTKSIFPHNKRVISDYPYAQNLYMRPHPMYKSTYQSYLFSTETQPIRSDSHSLSYCSPFGDILWFLSDIPDPLLPVGRPGDAVAQLPQILPGQGEAESRRVNQIDVLFWFGNGICSPRRDRIIWQLRKGRRYYQKTSRRKSRIRESTVECFRDQLKKNKCS